MDKIACARALPEANGKTDAEIKADGNVSPENNFMICAAGKFIRISPENPRKAMFRQM